MNVSLADRKNPNFPTLTVMGCKSPTLKKKGGKEGKFYHTTWKEIPLKNDHIFRNSDWMITVTTNEREGVDGS